MKIKILSFAIIGLLLFSGFLPNISGFSNNEIKSQDDESCYGFIIPVNQYQSNKLQMEISKLVNQLLRKDIDVYWIANQIYVNSKILDSTCSISKNYFEKGSYIIPFTNFQFKNALITSIVYSFSTNNKLKTYRLMESIVNIQVYKLNEPKIAFHNGPWIESHSFFNHLYRGGFYNYDFLSRDEISEKLNNEDYNVFIWGAGAQYELTNLFNFFESQIKYSDVQRQIREFVRNGGSYVGACYGAYETTFGNWLPLSFLKTRFLNMPSIYTMSINECKGLIALPGQGRIKVKITDPNHPISYGLPSYVTSLLAGGPIFLKPTKNTRVVGTFEDIDEWQTNSFSDKLFNLWFRFSKNRPIWVTNDFGKGKVVAFGDHPEIAQYNFSDPTTEQMGNFSRIIYNAVFFATSEGPTNIDIDKKVFFDNIHLALCKPEISMTGENILFNSSISGGTPAYNFLWDFGDDKNSFTQNTTHIFHKPNNYSVTLVVSDKENNIGINTSNIEIKGDLFIENNPPDKPNVSAIGPVVVRPNRMLFFIGESIDPDNDLFYLKLNTDDGLEWDNYTEWNIYFASNQNIAFRHLYTKTGKYNLRIKVIDIHGAESEWSDPIEIIVTKHPCVKRIFNK